MNSQKKNVYFFFANKILHDAITVGLRGDKCHRKQTDLKFISHPKRVKVKSSGFSYFPSIECLKECVSKTTLLLDGQKILL